MCIHFVPCSLRLSSETNNNLPVVSDDTMCNAQNNNNNNNNKTKIFLEPHTPHLPHKSPPHNFLSRSLHISPVALPHSHFSSFCLHQHTHSLPPTLIWSLSLSLSHRLTTITTGGILIGFTGEIL